MEDAYILDLMGPPACAPLASLPAAALAAQDIIYIYILL